MSSFVDTLKQLGPSRLAIMGGVLVILLMFFVFVTMSISSPELRLLYNDITPTDSTRITQTLQSANIPYDLSDDGSRIRVPENDVQRARMLLAQEGLPNGGSMGYELFDKQSGFGTTNFVQNINQVRALEGELARTIGSVDTVRSARVHLVLPQRKLFSRENQDSSASVFLSFRNAAGIQREQILAIQSLVASAVPDLKVDNVSVIDSNGNLLARGGEDSESLMPVKTEELRLTYEKRLTSSIEDIVSRIVGYGNVRANVTADLNFDRIQTNEELYDPETQVVRSTQLVEENNLEREPPSGQVSMTQNLPGVGGDVLADPKPVQEGSRIEEVTNYEISKTVRSMVREVGEVKKLSVAVLVDGTYTTDEEGNETYEPRSEEQIQQIESLVKSAVGFDEDRGDSIQVVNMKFAEVDTGENTNITNMIFGFERSDLLDAVEVLAVSIMVILIILLIVQPMLGRLLSSSGSALDSELETELLSGSAATAGMLSGPGGNSGASAGQIHGPVSAESGAGEGSSGGQQPQQQGGQDDDDAMIDMQSVQGKVKASAVKKVEDIVENYPSETVSVLRGWMSSEN
ncbi:MAG: flagellar basal-body MS-ring/collar protein FliF [Alphaproteobacteria bacterium]|nr:flagellar basal-body MS-ring/collar protein FliF [Alphaproteobacteria bacterium]MDP7223289.1 flagellar basal-body MS-ring/collar protein FliF [Alphaproteobacteria bacterium]